MKNVYFAKAINIDYRFNGKYCLSGCLYYHERFSFVPRIQGHPVDTYYIHFFVIQQKVNYV